MSKARPPTPSRREFLARGAAFLPAAAATMTELAPLLSAAGGDEGYWKLVREQFAFRDEKVPMNAANLCPAPRVVAERIVDLTRDIDLDCSFQNRDKFAPILEGAREKVARQLGVSADEIAFVRNTSEANNTINNGLALEAGDEILLWDQNHPTNNVAWEVRAKRFGYRVRRVATPAAPTSEDELRAVFVNAFSPRTRVLTITHASNISGQRLPVEALAEAARRRGIYLHVDGAQTWGAFDLNLLRLGVDSFTASAHKWFCGPKEVGLLYVRKEKIAEIWPNVVAPGWGADADPDVVGARKFESFGQRDDAALSAVETAADFHDLIGPARVEARVLELAARLKSGLRKLGVKAVAPADPALSAGVCIIEVPEAKRQELLDRMYHEHGIAGSTAGGFRLCPHIYNTHEHVDRAIEGIKRLYRPAA